jgi:hypothetical protein
MNILTSHIVEKAAAANHKLSQTNATLLNAVRALASEQYKNDVPEFDTMLNISHNSIPVSLYTVHGNEFFDVLINRIGATAIKALDFSNPLKVFKSDEMFFGDTYQEIYTLGGEEGTYNPHGTDSPFGFYDSRVEAMYHTVQDRWLFQLSYDDLTLSNAFTSDGAFDSFIDGLFKSFLSRNELKEYEKTILLVTNSLTPVTITKQDGTTDVVTWKTDNVDTTEVDYLTELSKKIITYSTLFTIPSTTRSENAFGVPKATAYEDQVLIVSAELSANIDMMLANAFNMGKAIPNVPRIIIDEFPTYTGTGDLEGQKPIAALVDRRALIIKDKALRMYNQFDPLHVRNNVFLHHHLLISYSLFENAHVWTVTDYTPE